MHSHEKLSAAKSIFEQRHVTSGINTATWYNPFFFYFSNTLQWHFPNIYQLEKNTHSVSGSINSKVFIRLWSECFYSTGRENICRERCLLSRNSLSSCFTVSCCQRCIWFISQVLVGRQQPQSTGGPQRRREDLQNSHLAPGDSRWEVNLGQHFLKEKAAQPSPPALQAHRGTLDVSQQNSSGRSGSFFESCLYSYSP